MEDMVRDMKDLIMANPLSALVVVVLAFVVLVDRVATKFLRVIDRLAGGGRDK